MTDEQLWYVDHISWNNNETVCLKLFAFKTRADTYSITV